MDLHRAHLILERLIPRCTSDLLTLTEVLVLLRARWQIELLFKLWKSHGHIDESRSAQPWRVLTEVFAKLEQYPKMEGRQMMMVLAPR